MRWWLAVKVLTEQCQFHRHSDAKGDCNTACLNSTGDSDGWLFTSDCSYFGWVGSDSPRNSCHWHTRSELYINSLLRNNHDRYSNFVESKFLQEQLSEHGYFTSCFKFHAVHNFIYRLSIAGLYPQSSHRVAWQTSAQASQALRPPNPSHVITDATSADIYWHLHRSDFKKTQWCTHTWRRVLSRLVIVAKAR